MSEVKKDGSAVPRGKRWVLASLNDFSDVDAEELDEKGSSNAVSAPVSIPAQQARAVSIPQQLDPNRRPQVIPTKDDFARKRAGMAMSMEDILAHKAVRGVTRGGKGAKGKAAAGKSSMHMGDSSAGMVLHTRLVASEGASSNGSGTCYNAFNVYTDATSGVLNLGETASFSSLFRQYRITGITFHFIPYTPFKVEASVATNGRHICVALDPDDDSTPSSFLQVFANSNAKPFHTNYPTVLTKHWQNSDKRWFDLLDSANPLVPQMAIKVAGDANIGTSIPFGLFVFEYFVDFRARL